MMPLGQMCRSRPVTVRQAQAAPLVGNWAASHNVACINRSASWQAMALSTHAGRIGMVATSRNGPVRGKPPGLRGPFPPFQATIAAATCGLCLLFNLPCHLDELVRARPPALVKAQLLVLLATRL